MKKSILIEKEIDIKYINCSIDVGWWEDANVNGEIDDNDNPTMPCVYEDKWCPIIDLDEGRIINWNLGVEAQTNYKVRDGVSLKVIDNDNHIVKYYEGYVPKVLTPDNPGWFRGEDYLEMTIDKFGYIKNFDNNLDDIFEYGE